MLPLLFFFDHLFLFLFFPFQEGISLAWSPCVALVILTLAVFLMCPWPLGHWRWALRWSSTFAVLWFVALASRALAFVGFTGGAFVTGTLAVHWNWWIVCSMFLSFFLLGPVERWSHLRVIFSSFPVREIYIFFSSRRYITFTCSALFPWTLAVLWFGALVRRTLTVNWFFCSAFGHSDVAMLSERAEIFHWGGFKSSTCSVALVLGTLACVWEVLMCL